MVCLGLTGFGQNVNIPDVNFKNCLLGNPSINILDGEPEPSTGSVGRQRCLVGKSNRILGGTDSYLEQSTCRNNSE